MMQLSINDGKGRKEIITVKSIRGAKQLATLKRYGINGRVWILNKAGKCLAFKDPNKPWQTINYYFNNDPITYKSEV